MSVRGDVIAYRILFAIDASTQINIFAVLKIQCQKSMMSQRDEQNTQVPACAMLYEPNNLLVDGIAKTRICSFTDHSVFAGNNGTAKRLFIRIFLGS